MSPIETAFKYQKKKQLTMESTRAMYVWVVENILTHLHIISPHNNIEFSIHLICLN